LKICHTSIKKILILKSNCIKGEGNEVNGQQNGCGALPGGG